MPSAHDRTGGGARGDADRAETDGKRETDHGTFAIKKLTTRPSEYGVRTWTPSRHYHGRPLRLLGVGLPVPPHDTITSGLACPSERGGSLDRPSPPHAPRCAPRLGLVPLGSTSFEAV